MSKKSEAVLVRTTAVRRFLLFTHPLYEPDGGWRDLRGSYNSVHNLRQAVSALRKRSEDCEKGYPAEYHVVDLETGEVIWNNDPDWKPNPNMHVDPSWAAFDFGTRHMRYAFGCRCS